MLAVAVTGCAMHNSDLMNPPTAAGKPPTRIAAAVRYVHRIAAEAADLQHAVQAVEAGLQSLALNPGSADRNAIDQLAQLVQQQRADISGAEKAFGVPTARGQIGTWEAETVLAAHDLTTALDALAHYLADSTTAPPAQYSQQLAEGSTEWNDAVTNLWAAAGVSNPPSL